MRQEAVSVNVGALEMVRGPSYECESGIVKRPVAGRVRVGELGLESDVIVSEKHHGGVDQAVYVYRQEDYDWWSGKLQRPLEPGLFGENLTLVGLPSADALIGSRIRFADLELEVTSPRQPCATFATRMEQSDMIRQFIAAERSGFYCRVIVPGTVESGQPFTFAAPPSSGASTVELFRSHYAKPGAEDMRRFLTAPISERLRTKFEVRLENE
jgi:MOSC domain-containing protein YiiM